MTRIKSDNIQIAGSFVVPADQNISNQRIQDALTQEKEILLRAETQAQSLIEEAKKQCEKLVEDAVLEANSKVDEITQAAHKQGFEAGYQEGYEKISADMQEKILAVENFAQSVFEIKKSIVKSAHLDVVKLVVEVSKKVCTKSLDLDEKALADITEQAIRSLKDKEDITIIINPVMAEKIYGISEELKSRIPQLSSIKIVEDSSVSPDGTIVESPLSRVDCRITSQINEISEKLMGELNSISDAELMQEIDKVENND